MLTDFETFRKSLLDSGYKVFRDKATKETPYPYIVYSYIGETQKWASNKFIATIGLYQVSLFTSGVEQDLKPLKTSFKNYGIYFNGFSSIQGDENDDTITNFYTEVRVFENEG
ncbi:hypothetical protein UA1_02286 [Enterococcus faecalis EnGen0234]|uniref:hypothetical protein n=1 Tax=Enterococcus faecalis TaxID=1351 RepID=UPI000330D336|nr:hypothetical protein [Enterococcus faecalis]EOM13956.1 hypothetical protein UA1_02286 [Enterococcus faecalis EnGen0234]MBT0787702.1 hypothetical protein [Enterococcus faecalis]